MIRFVGFGYGKDGYGGAVADMFFLLTLTERSADIWMDDRRAQAFTGKGCCFQLELTNDIYEPHLLGIERAALSIWCIPSTTFFSLSSYLSFDAATWHGMCGRLKHGKDGYTQRCRLQCLQGPSLYRRWFLTERWQIRSFGPRVDGSLPQHLLACWLDVRMLHTQPSRTF